MLRLAAQPNAVYGTFQRVTTGNYNRPMYPIRLAFAGYSLIGETLMITSLAVLLLIVRQPDKPRGAWMVAVFFGCIAMSGANTVLANGLVYWSSLFAPWQDFWVIAGGVALTQYAFASAGELHRREARVVLALTGLLALTALLVCVVFSYRFVFRWSPDLAEPESYYLLLPLGTSLVVAIFLHRTVTLSRAASRVRLSPWRCLRDPRDSEALLSRNLAIAFALGFLPGIAMLLDLPNTLAFVIQHLGALLAVAAVALVYLNYAPVITSFVAKLTGIALIAVLLLVGAIGNYYCEYVEAQLHREQLSLVVRTRALLDAGAPLSLPPPVSYVVSWDSARVQAREGYRLLFEQPDQTAFDLEQLVTENRQGRLVSTPLSLPHILAMPFDGQWSSTLRWRTFPFGSNSPDFQAYRYEEDGRTYEIGLQHAYSTEQLSKIARAWLVLLGVASLLVLFVFPAFFQVILVRPLMTLLAGVERVNAGALDTTVPARYPDEIGKLTAVFNELTRTLKASREELEQRVAARTRELSAFFELAMLSDLGEELELKLRPALLSIMEAGKCGALCLHLCPEDENILQLVNHIEVPESALAAMRSFAVPATFAARLHGGAALVTDMLPRDREIPHPLRIAHFRSYIGAPLGPAGRVHGWLSCYREDVPGFGLSETALLVALARQVGVIIENHLLQQRTGRLAAIEERQRLARDLHDSVTQLMYSLTLFSQAGKQAIDDEDLPRVERNLEKVAETAQLALREMRSLLFELQPPSLEEGGLAQALEERLNIVERRVGIRVDARIDDSLEIPLSVERELYHIAMETLNNSLRHSQADEILVIMAREHGGVQMTIADNGCGFEAARPRRGLGLPGIKERAKRLGAALRFDSRPGSGARTTISVPLGRDEAVNE